MPQADFYILTTTLLQEKERFTCRLVEKAWHQGYRIYIHTESAEQLERLDNLLWTFKQDSFLPHDIYPEVTNSVAPIRLGCSDTLSDFNGQVLVNLASNIPSFFNHFARIAEIIIDDNSRETGRQHFRFYREQKFVLNTHEIDKL